MSKDYSFEDIINNIDRLEVAVLRDVNKFPIYGEEFSSPNMVICLNLCGRARALYDLCEVTFVQNELAVVMPNHILQPIESSDDYSSIMIVLSNTFVEELRHITLTHDHSKYHRSPSCILTDIQVAQAKKMAETIDVFSGMSVDILPNRHQILLSLLDVAFELLNAFRKESHIISFEPHEKVIFNRFCDLLARYHRQTRNISDYAKMLHLTPKYFSSYLIPKVAGVTAGEWIDQYMISQIKKALITRSDLSIQQIAYEFGFSEPSTFSRYFKNLTGVTPSKYRRQ